MITIFCLFNCYGYVYYILGIEISDFEGYELGLKAINKFDEGSLLLTVPNKVMMSEKNTRESDLSTYINVDPVLQNMPNITLALFLLYEKTCPGMYDI